MMKELNKQDIRFISGGEGADFSGVTATFDSTEEIVEPAPNWQAFIPGMFR